MKAKIHPTYYSDCVVTCACGTTLTVGSTKPQITVEICSACHPFFTGEMRFVDTMGRVERFQQRQATVAGGVAAEAKRLLADPSVVEMAREEIERIEKEIENINKVINDNGPTSPEATLGVGQDFNSIIVEGRPGVGGDEAKIWAEDLLRMYSRFAEFNKWSVEQLDNGVIGIKGQGVYQKLRWETGVHRVQRVPETEAAGRIHTSTASIVVLPEIPESQVEVREDDLQWQFTTGGGHGGQNVNKVATAVRLTHKPSGI